jgi:hypothetical protein
MSIILSVVYSPGRRSTEQAAITAVVVLDAEKEMDVCCGMDGLGWDGVRNRGRQLFIGIGNSERVIGERFKSRSGRLS